MNIIKKYENEIYSLFVLLVSLLAWSYSIYGIIIMSIGLVASLFMKKFKYVIPWLLNFVFTINIDLSLNVEIKPFLYIVVGIVIVSLIIYMFTKKPTLKVGDSKIIYILMAISTLLPIIWSKAINYTHLFMYFSWILYALLYFFTIYSNDEDNKEIFVQSMINLGLLIAIQVILVSIKANGFNVDKILSSSLRVGWGIFNECGIMMLVTIPYIFYFIHKKKFYYLSIIKLLIILIACFFTNSRGTYIFGIMIVILSLILLSVLTKKTKGFYLSLIFTTVILVSFGGIFHSKIIEIIIKIKEYVFYNGLSNNGRFDLYQYGINKLFSNFKFTLFGMGFVESYYIDFNQSSSMKDIFLVYHSTIIQTLSIGGMIGLFLFIIFMYKRYVVLIKEISNDLYKFLLIGLIPIEFYGLIDNTYHMFYFMIPLVISMGIFETYKTGKEVIKC